MGSHLLVEMQQCRLRSDEDPLPSAAPKSILRSGWPPLMVLPKTSSDACEVGIAFSMPSPSSSHTCSQPVMLSVPFLLLYPSLSKSSCLLRVPDVIFTSCYRDCSLSLAGVVSDLNSKTWPSMSVVARAEARESQQTFAGIMKAALCDITGSLGRGVLSRSAVSTWLSRSTWPMYSSWYCGKDEFDVERRRVSVCSAPRGALLPNAPNPPHRSFVDTFVRWGVVAPPVATPHARRSESAPLWMRTGSIKVGWAVASARPQATPGIALRGGVIPTLSRCPQLHCLPLNLSLIPVRRVAASLRHSA